MQSSLVRAITQFNDTKQQVNNIFQQIYSSLEIEKTQKSLIQEFYLKFNSKTVNDYLKKISQNKNNSFQTTQSTIATIKKSQLTIKDLVKDFDIGFTKVIETVSKNISTFKKVLTESQYVPFSKKFSKINKAQCLTISEDQKTTKRTQGSGGYPINLLQSPLTKENCEVSFRIIQQPGNKGIWMGIAILNIVKNNNFLSCYGIGKGTYAIDQVGTSHQSAYTWNHHDINYNSQPKVGWQFHIGDIVKIKVDFSKSTVTFKKNQSQYVQPIKLDLGDIYAFAGPTNLGDCLQIC